MPGSHWNVVSNLFNRYPPLLDSLVARLPVGCHGVLCERLSSLETRLYGECSNAKRTRGARPRAAGGSEFISGAGIASVTHFEPCFAYPAFSFEPRATVPSKVRI